MSVPNIKILSQVVSEKSLTEIFFLQTNRQTNTVTEKAKTIYPLYTSYARGKINLAKCHVYMMVGYAHYLNQIFMDFNVKSL